MNDKRREPRYPCGWLASAHGANGTLSNLSMSGAQLAVPELSATMLRGPIERDAVMLTLHTPDGPVEVQCRVVYDSPWDDERLLGVVFTSMTSQAKAALEAAIACLASSRRQL